MAATSDQVRESTMTRTKRTSAVSKENQMQLACPRCDSTNTKFCYYNNYNFSQPRHFCKSCRRYWTLGGALRDIPVGGGSRRSSTKRPRTTTTAAPPTAVSPLGSFGSLLGAGPAAGFLAFAGFGLGFEGVGSFGMGRGVGWSTFTEDGSIANQILVGTNGGGHTWQFESGGVGGGVGSDCFPWPADLAIPTSGHGLKLN